MLLPGSVVATPVGKQSIQLSFSEIELNENSLPADYEDEECARVVFFQRGESRDSCFMAVRDFDSKIIRGEKEDGKTEQAGRASVRQAVMSLKLESQNATGSELKVLKALQIIGKRAPCASLLSVDDTIRLLRSFGKDNIAERLDTAVKVLLPDSGSSRGSGQSGARSGSFNASRSGSSMQSATPCPHCAESKRLYEQAMAQLAICHSQLASQAQVQAQAHAQVNMLTTQPSPAAIAALTSPDNTTTFGSDLFETDPGRNAIVEQLASALAMVRPDWQPTRFKSSLGVVMPGSNTTRELDAIREVITAFLDRSLPPSMSALSDDERLAGADLLPRSLRYQQYLETSGSDESLLSIGNLQTLLAILDAFEQRMSASPSPASTPQLEKSTITPSKFGRQLANAGSAGSSPSTSRRQASKSTTPSKPYDSEPNSLALTATPSSAPQSSLNSSVKPNANNAPTASAALRAIIPLALGSTSATRLAQGLASLRATIAGNSPTSDNRRSGASIQALCSLLATATPSSEGAVPSPCQPSVYLAQIGSVQSTPLGARSSPSQLSPASSIPGGDVVKAEQPTPVKLEAEIGSGEASVTLDASGLATNATSEVSNKHNLMSGIAATPATTPTTLGASNGAAAGSSTPTLPSSGSRLLKQLIAYSLNYRASGGAMPSTTPSATTQSVSDFSNSVGQGVPQLSQPANSIASLILTHPTLALLPAVVVKDMAQTLQRAFGVYLASLISQANATDSLQNKNADSFATSLGDTGSTIDLITNVSASPAAPIAPSPSGLNALTGSESSLSMMSNAASFGTLGPAVLMSNLAQSPTVGIPMQISPTLPYTFTAPNSAPGTDPALGLNVQHQLNLPTIDRGSSTSSQFGAQPIQASNVMLPRSISSSIGGPYGGTNATNSPSAITTSLMQSSGAYARNPMIGTKRTDFAGNAAGTPQQGTVYLSQSAKRRQQAPPSQIYSYPHPTNFPSEFVAPPGAATTPFTPAAGIFSPSQPTVGFGTSALGTKRVIGGKFDVGLSSPMNNGSSAIPGSTPAAMRDLIGNSSNAPTFTATNSAPTIAEVNTNLLRMANISPSTASKATTLPTRPAPRGGGSR